MFIRRIYRGRLLLAAALTFGATALWCNESLFTRAETNGTASDEGGGPGVKGERRTQSPPTKAADPSARVPHPAETERPHVYTNDDLAKYARPEDRVANPKLVKEAREAEEAFQKQALKDLLQKAVVPPELAQRRLKAEQRVMDASKRLESLKGFEAEFGKSMNVKQGEPIVLPRPRDGQVDTSALDRRTRLIETREEIKVAEEELRLAQAELAGILNQIGGARRP